MDCVFVQIEPSAVRCERCGFAMRTPDKPDACHRKCRKQSSIQNDHGPGTSLKAILSELGIKPTASCGCEAMVAKMNVWGEACNEHREEILEHLRIAYDSASTLTAIRAGLNSLRGYPKTLAGLLDLAIENAKKEKLPPAAPAADAST